MLVMSRNIYILMLNASIEANFSCKSHQPIYKTVFTAATTFPIVSLHHKIGHKIPTQYSTLNLPLCMQGRQHSKMYKTCGAAACFNNSE